MRFDAEHCLISAINNYFRRYHAGETTLVLTDGIGTRVVFEDDMLRSLGVAVHQNSAMPNVVFYDPGHNWLILIDAVTNGRPMDAQRLRQLRKIFVGVSDMLVFISAFATRDAFARKIGEISWESVVWLADDPAHLVHFGGNRMAGARVWEQGVERKE